MACGIVKTVQQYSSKLVSMQVRSLEYATGLNHARRRDRAQNMSKNNSMYVQLFKMLWLLDSM